MANIFLITSRSRRARSSMKSKNTEGKISNPNSSSDNHFSCKKHPKHRQSPGVCALCLTKRLSKLSLEYTSSSSETASSCWSSSSSSSSVSSWTSSSSVSSCSSPLQYQYMEKKKDGKKQGSLFRFLLGSIID